MDRTLQLCKGVEVIHASEYDARYWWLATEDHRYTSNPLLDLPPGPAIFSGVLDPGYNLDLVLKRALSSRGCMIWDLMIPDSVLPLPADVREGIGRILQLCSPIVMFDKTSCDWLAHFGIDPKYAVPWAISWQWLVDLRLLNAMDETTPLSYVLQRRRDDETEHLEHPEGFLGSVKFGGKNENHVLERRYNTLRSVGFGQQMITQSETFWDSHKMTETSDDAIEEHLRRIVGSANLISESEVIENNKKPRRLELGSIFDPATHYTPHYYDGRGLEYMRQDGEWSIYHGTGLEWHGFEHIANVLASFARIHGDKQVSLLDIGCSNGDFLRHAAEEGFQVRGVDLGDVKSRAHPSVRDNITEGAIQDFESDTLFEFTTAWDFWEHLFLQDINKVIRRVSSLMKVGGRHFACICTRGINEADIFIEPGTTFTKENSWLLCSGHVSIARMSWWLNRFAEASDGALVPDFRNTHLLNMFLAEHPEMIEAARSSWSARHVIVLKRRF